MNNFIALLLKTGFLLFSIAFATISFAQEKYTISGYVRDANSGETLIAANVFVQDDVTKGVTTNVYGFFSLTLPEGNYSLIAAYLGYAEQNIEVVSVSYTHLTLPTIYSV